LRHGCQVLGGKNPVGAGSQAIKDCKPGRSGEQRSRKESRSSDILLVIRLVIVLVLVIDYEHEYDYEYEGNPSWRTSMIQAIFLLTFSSLPSADPAPAFQVTEDEERVKIVGP